MDRTLEGLLNITLHWMLYRHRAAKRFGSILVFGRTAGQKGPEEAWVQFSPTSKCKVTIGSEPELVYLHLAYGDYAKTFRWQRRTS